jgi:hypothetical protein
MQYGAGGKRITKALFTAPSTVGIHFMFLSATPETHVMLRYAGGLAWTKSVVLTHCSV